MQCFDRCDTSSGRCRRGRKVRQPAFSARLSRALTVAEERPSPPNPSRCFDCGKCAAVTRPARAGHYLSDNLVGVAAAANLRTCPRPFHHSHTRAHCLDRTSAVACEYSGLETIAAASTQGACYLADPARRADLCERVKLDRKIAACFVGGEDRRGCACLDAKRSIGVTVGTARASSGPAMLATKGDPVMRPHIRRAA